MRIGAAAVLLATVAAPSPDPDADPLAEPRRDPNEAPFMKPKFGGARPDGDRWDPDFAEGKGEHRRVQFTIKPLFASFPIGFAGRARALTDPTRGGGVGLDFDVLLHRPFWLRLTGTYSGHPVPAVYRRNDDMMLEPTAARGTFHAAYVGGGLVYAMDYGRLLPLLEVGAGAMFMRHPGSVTAGQMGGECIDNAVCDIGLRCNTQQNLCQPGATGTIHFGIGLEILVGKRWTVGAGLRYFALLAAPAVYPVYLQAAARFGLRF